MNIVNHNLHPIVLVLQEYTEDRVLYNELVRMFRAYADAGAKLVTWV